MLEDGTVLVTGGETQINHPTNRCSLYDPVADRWRPAAELSTAPLSAGVAAIAGGALIVGGRVKTDSDRWGAGQATCQRYDLAGGNWKKAPDAPFAMERLRCHTLRDGRVLVVETRVGWAIYDPTRDAWTHSGKHERIQRCFSELPDGRVVLFGVDDGRDGNRQTAYLDPSTGRVKRSGASTKLPHIESQTLALVDGSVLLVGGDLYNNIATEPELWTPSGGVALPGLEKAVDRQVKARAKYEAKKKKER
jgi:hypothetical protein